MKNLIYILWKNTMSHFEIILSKIDKLTPIQNADRIEIASIGGYNTIVKKGQVKVGDGVLYLPEASVLPQDILSMLGLWDSEKNKGRLSGSMGNRISAIKLRGVLSQGIVLTVDMLNFDGNNIYYNNQSIKLEENKDYKEFLGIKKYEPVIPVHMAGEVCNVGTDNTLKYDIENYKKYHYVFEQDEEVIITEKLHGSFCCIGYSKTKIHDEISNGKIFAASKGLGSSGLVMKDNDSNKSNIYLQVLKNTMEINEWENLLDAIADMYNVNNVFILGEVFGSGVQDLNYSLTKPDFRAFDIYVGNRNNGKYLNWDDVRNIINNLVKNDKIKTVPELYRGKINQEVLETLRSGKTTLGGNHIREGIVIKPLQERYNERIGRVIVKHINDEYLTRNNGTEYN